MKMLDTRWTEVQARALVRERSQGRCEAGRPGCDGLATEVHHRRGRGQGGSWHPANLLHLCGTDHRWIGLNRDAAHLLGLELRVGDDLQRPVALNHPVYGAAWWVLDDRGDLVWDGVL